MKKQLYISVITALALIIIVPSCTKDTDFLDKTPKGVLSTSSSYKTQKDAEAAINGAYTVLLDFWLKNIAFEKDIISDDAVKGHGADLSALTNMDNLNFNATDGAIQTIWSQFYKGVYLSNIVLDYIPDIEMDEAIKSRILGEAHFLRGFYYYNLAIRWGGVPLMTTTIDADNSPAKATFDQTWSLIKDDLIKASELLPWKNEYTAVNVGRADKGAALALLGSAYLFTEEWQKSFDAYSAVVNSGIYGLETEFGNIFMPEADNGIEVVFETQMRGGEEFAYANGFNFWVRPRNGSTIFGLGFCMPTQDLVDEFEEGDPRLRYTVIREGDIISDEVADIPFQAVWAPETGMNCGKYVVGVPVGNLAERHEQNQKQIRYAEVLLGYAEAAFRIGNTGEAVAKINLVRERARGNNNAVLPDVTAGQDIFEAIVHERRVELALEGKRYFDLVRWGLAESELGDLGYRPATKGLYPIPQTELDVNPNLVQNTGF
jgi:starch-binding outer membrane protein, SusD/RagB family